MSQEDKEFREQISAEAPDDVATLYSWANLHGAKYRDFSASRREHRAQMRASLQAEAARVAAEASARAPKPATPLASQPLSHSGSPFAQDAPVVYVREFEDPPARPAQPSAARPAWLAGEAASVPPFVPSPLQEPMQGSREQTADRWFALKNVVEHSQSRESAATSADVRVPTIAVFSLAGGVGKTSLVATLGRAISSFGERALLVDASSYGLLPYYFGSRESRPGVVRTFAPPAGTLDAPIHLLSLESESRAGEASQDWIAESIVRSSNGMQRVLIDASTASGPLARQVLRAATAVLVPIVPDLNSVVSLAAVDNFFRQHHSADGRAIQPFYLLNQFDASLPLHLDVREVLRQQLGDRLLPTVVRRSPAVSEGLAEGMTVVDYAPASPVTEDYLNIAAWLRNLSAPAATAFRGTRWSER
jgi:cellulose synthase operon protein YhjQ